MKLSHLLLTTSLCAVAAIPAQAQARPFGEVDVNSDGQLSLQELQEVFGRSGASNIMKRRDLDGDGFVSVAEIQVSQDDESDESDDDESDESDDNESDESDDDESDESDDDESDESDDDESDESDDDESDESDDDESDESDD